MIITLKWEPFMETGARTKDKRFRYGRWQMKWYVYDRVTRRGVLCDGRLAMRLWMSAARAMRLRHRG